MADDTELFEPHARSFPRVLGTQRTLQVVLGLFWILDGALQFQPFMFGKGFVDSFILGNASGQPAPISWFLTNVGHFITPDVAVWNTLFALIQVGIGVGLLFSRTVRPALGVSFVWVLGVWFFGEGLGMIFTGTASPLTGAPGAVLMYGLLGLMAWPKANAASTQDDEATGVASSAAGRGIGGAVTPLAAWSGLWILSAILFLLPANRTATSISSAITGMAPGTPSWYGHFLTSTGSWLGASGATTSWILAIVSIVVGVGPLLVRRPGIFLFLGGLFAALLWIMGQGWLGGIFSGSGTDPNIGPLIVVLALAMVPARVATDPAVLTPARALMERRPAVSVGAVAIVGAALALSATYPVAAEESTTTAMSGMSMAGSSSSGTSGSSNASATESTCTQKQTGMPHAGLDLNNTPYMVMSGNLGMDMNGADASAAAGLNTTKENWHYTGPALPASTASVLLAQGSNSPDTIHMAAAGCAKAVTATELLGSTQYVQSTSQAAAQYATPAEAMAAGYVAVTPTDYPVVTYVNPSIVAANAAAKRTLNPGFIDGLVYATVPSGDTVLVAAMYILPSTVATAPMPYGALVQWHQRTNVCVPTGTEAGASYQVSGIAPCAAGTVRGSTPYVTYVWQVPVAGGPLAIQPPDLQVVEAAVMASS